MRIRITFEKQGALRYIGHLDLHKIWERSTRRANITLAYSQGFHPMPKIQLASALPLGFSSIAEVVDLFTVDDHDLVEFHDRLQNAVPSGIHIRNVEAVDSSVPPLQVQVTAARFQVQLGDETSTVDDLAKVRQNLEGLLARDEIWRERRGKQYDLRPLIEEASLGEDGKLDLRLSAREAATGRPEEVLAELGIAFENTDIERTEIIFK